MSEPLDIESDPFLMQLTDALRAGPGSPEWHTAVTKLRKDGVQGSSEHAMIVAVREHLESGKEYRTVRAGPGFTRRLMDRIDEEAASKHRSWPLATIIAIVGGFVVVALIAALVYVISPNSEAERTAELAGLRSGAFGQTVAQASFDGGSLTNWQESGGEQVKLDTAAGLRPATTQPSKQYMNAVLSTTSTVRPNERAVFEVLVAQPSDPTLIVQLFVEEKQLDASRPEELAWTLQNGEAQVALPDGRFANSGTKFSAGKEGSLVRIAVGPTMTVVTSGGRELYAGSHFLSATNLRAFGIRFLTKGGRAGDGVVLSARVAKP